MITELLQAWQQGFSVPDRRQVYEWAAEHVSLPNSYAAPGPFDVSRSRYMVEPFEALKNSRIRQVNIGKAVQTGGSLIADIWVAWLICNDPASVLWIFQDEETAKKYAETRLHPILNGSDEIKSRLPLGRNQKKKTEIFFKNMSLFLGSATPNQLQTLSIRNFIADEVWLWKSGYVRQGKARTTSFAHTSKCLLISQGGTVEDDFDQEFKQGIQKEWAWVCPHCKQAQLYKWSSQRPDGTWAGLVWETNEKTKPAGKYNYTELGKTCKLECFYCRHQVEDTPANRRMLNDTGCYLTTDSSGDPSILSYRWNALASTEISFASLAAKYLKAKAAQDELGYSLPLQEFYQKCLALPWNEAEQYQYQKAAMEEYNPADKWSDEAYRFLTIDCQQDLTKFWCCVRSWAKTGESRLLYFNQINDWQQIRELQQKYAVKDQHVFIDSGYLAHVVYSKAVSFGHEGIIRGKRHWLSWQCLKGTNAEYYAHEAISGNKERRIYSPLKWGNPAIGQAKAQKLAPLYLWCNTPTKDILFRYKAGKAAKWVTPVSESPEVNLTAFNDQLGAEVKKPVKDTAGKTVFRYEQIRKDNHALDCEAMQIVAAAMCNVLDLSGAADIVELPQEEPQQQLKAAA